MASMADKKYTFVVDIHANKSQIKNAIETIFDVKVEDVKTARIMGKTKRVGVHIGKRPDYKKLLLS